MSTRSLLSIFSIDFVPRPELYMIHLAFMTDPGMDAVDASEFQESTRVRQMRLIVSIGCSVFHADVKRRTSAKKNNNKRGQIQRAGRENRTVQAKRQAQSIVPRQSASPISSAAQADRPRGRLSRSHAECCRLASEHRWMSRLT